jgi:uncharacterized protein (UPF0147 family)
MFKYDNYTTNESLLRRMLSLTFLPSFKICGDSMATEEVIKQCVEVLERIMSDDTVPRNIRRSAESAKNGLLEKGDPEAVRAASAISILDEISNDPNIPLHTRTLIWNVASQLETIPVE